MDGIELTGCRDDGRRADVDRGVAGVRQVDDQGPVVAMTKTTSSPLAVVTV